MNKTKMVGYPFGAAVVASLLVLFLGMCLFGFRLSEWNERQGIIVGAVSTVTAVAAAALGVRMALRENTREFK